MLVFRYLAKEVLITLFALTLVFTLILVSNQLVGYLNRAASGRIPGILVLQLMTLELPNLLSLLLPLGFYMALILALGRLYSENEMVVLHAGGLSISRVLCYALSIAMMVATVVVMMVSLNPSVAVERARLLNTSGMKAFIQILAPQQFQVLPQNQVLYINEINRSHTKAEGLFLAKMNADTQQPWQWQIIAAHELYLRGAKGSADELVLQQGSVYRLSPGSLKAQYGTFEQAVLKLPEPDIQQEHDLRTLSFKQLWRGRHRNSAMHAELQWRLSIPLMTFILAVIAVPLSQVDARSGKFAKILPAILIFLVYTNLLFVWRENVVKGQWYYGAHMLWVHLFFLCLGLWLLWRQKRRLYL